MIFGTVNPEETSHQMITSVSTAHVKCSHTTLWKADNFHLIENSTKLECGPMPNMMAALTNIGGALCSTPQSLADAHYHSGVQ